MASERERLVGEQDARRKNVRDSIVQALAKMGDENIKVVLMLLLEVVEDIGDKIDAVLNDERSLRETVLNGHEAVHTDHHEWIERKMAEEKEAAANAKADARIARETLIRQVVISAVSMAFGGLGMLVMMK